MEIKTLKDLKDFLGTLDEEQLSQEAALQIVDSGAEQISFAHANDEVEVLTDEGFMPRSVIEDEDEIISEETRPIGYVYLFNEH